MHKISINMIDVFIVLSKNEKNNSSVTNPKQFTRNSIRSLLLCHAFLVNCARKKSRTRKVRCKNRKKLLELCDLLKVCEVEASVALITSCIICGRKILHWPLTQQQKIECSGLTGVTRARYVKCALIVDTLLTN